MRIQNLGSEPSGSGSRQRVLNSVCPSSPRAASWIESYSEHELSPRAVTREWDAENVQDWICVRMLMLRSAAGRSAGSGQYAECLVQDRYLSFDAAVGGWTKCWVRLVRSNFRPAEAHGGSLADFVSSQPSTRPLTRKGL